MDWLGEIMKANGWLPLMLVVGTFIAVMTIAGQITKTLRARAFEQSRREIAAYVAEGSITPEQAATLLAVGPAAGDAEDASMKLAQAVAWGSVDQEDASKLVEARDGADEANWKRMVDLVIEGMPVEDAVKLGRAKPATA